jgi:hypothetical protein
MKLSNVVTGFAAQLLDVAARAARGTALAALRVDGVLLACEPTEPVFVLCARDPEAIECLEVWVSLRTAKLVEARRILGVDGATPGTLAYERLERMRAKVHEAGNVVQAFVSYQDRLATAARKVAR